MKKTDPLISLCMIVKNEEKNLAACLDSIVGHVDEIIIVDTGSTDKTCEIAKKYNVKLYNYLWNYNFSDARNFALQQATGDWIFNIDADHIFELTPEGNLKEFLRKTEKLGVLIDERSYEDEKQFHSLDRLLIFRNKMDFKYKGVIHEHPYDSIHAYSRKNNIKNPLCSFEKGWVSHFGYTDPVLKLNRNLKILKNAVKHEPDNFHYRLKLLLTMRGLGDDEEYKKYLLENVLRIEKKNPPLTESIVGIWGLFGQWVLQDNNAENIDIFYKSALLINEKTRFRDIRLVWPYVKVSIIQKKYTKAIADLKKCILSGIAPNHIALSTDERLAPVYQLIKLIHDTSNVADLLDCIHSLPALLKKTSLSEQQCFNFIRRTDKKLYDAIAGIMNDSQKLCVQEASPDKKTDKKPLISLCMIVKNEQENLERCLKSVRGIADELIIIDTGSTDRSINIAKSYSAQVHSVIWENDFSIARNKALDKANGEWILHLDADEELNENTRSNIKTLLEQTKSDALNLVLRNFQPDGDIISYTDEKQVRLFRNKPEYRYSGRIHEQIVNSIARENGSFSDSGIIVNHYGYKKGNMVKAERNLNLLNKELQEKPEDAYLLFKLGETFKALKNYDKAEECLIKAISNPQGNITIEIKEVIYLRLGQISLSKDNYEQAKKYASACLRFNGKNAMAKYILGIALMYLGDIDDALELFRELKATQKIHNLDLTEIESIMQVVEKVSTPEMLN